MRSQIKHMSYSPMRPELFSKRESAERKNSFSHTPPRINVSTLAKDAASKVELRSARPLAGFPIIAHCHLCWDWVWQRPQQFLSRLSRNHRILFVETRAPEPNLVSPLARWEILEAFQNITILRIQFPTSQWEDAAFIDQERRRLVQSALKGPLAGQFDNAVQWFYDPMAITAFDGQLGEIATVYDCMDELSQFRGAPPELIAREAMLLSKADVVFAGGRKLHEAKSRQNPNCHFYGCGVDGAHFGRAR